MNFLTQAGGAFTQQAIDVINGNFSLLLGYTQGQGTAYFIDALNGRDFYNGKAPTVQADGITGPVQTLQRAYNLTVAGKNDTVVILGNGATSATVRQDTAFTWAKDSTHLFGVASGVNISNRARIAPTPATTAFANFFTVSSNGCKFGNVQWIDGFTTGTTAEILMTVSGGRNLFESCHLAGMANDAAAQSATSRSLKITTTGENMFVNTTIGVDTVTRTQANASVEFAGGAPRNQFLNCVFPFMGSAAGVLGIIVAAAAGSDRFQHFDNCSFINAIGSTSTTMSALATLAASMGGLLHFKDCSLVGITEYGTDATSLAQIRVMGASGTAATTGIAIQPS